MNTDKCSCVHMNIHINTLRIFMCLDYVITCIHIHIHTIHTHTYIRMDSELHFLGPFEGLDQAGSTSLIPVGRDGRRAALCASKFIFPAGSTGYPRNHTYQCRHSDGL